MAPHSIGGSKESYPWYTDSDSDTDSDSEGDSLPGRLWRWWWRWWPSRSGPTQRDHSHHSHSHSGALDSDYYYNDDDDNDEEYTGDTTVEYNTIIRPTSPPVRSPYPHRSLSLFLLGYVDDHYDYCSPPPALQTQTQAQAQEQGQTQGQTQILPIETPIGIYSHATMPSQAHVETVSSFIQDAPPGELSDILADIKNLTISDPSIASSLAPAFEKYNEDQFATAKLPGGAGRVVVSAHNALGNGRYYDVESSSSFEFDHAAQKASNVQSHVLESDQAELVKSTLKSLGTYVKEHYRDATFGVFPTDGDSKVAVIIVANKYSPKNYWNGRWRSLYVFDPATGALTGTIKVDVHYYEDGNVRLQTGPLSGGAPSVSTTTSASGAAIVREIAAGEKRYQDDVNRGFSALSEGAFKSLRRQLPVTRQKIEWDKVTSYRLGQDIGGGPKR